MPKPLGESAPTTQFSADRAFLHVARLAEGGPRPIGTQPNRAAGDYILGQITALGAEGAVQESAVSSQTRRGDYVVSFVRNISARVAGSSNTKSVLLVAHYDSVMTSPGAADDAWGVAVLLEVLRALRAGPPLRNDVLLLFTDGEERALSGAHAFVDQQASAKSIGAVLNLDARGSGGPALLFETGNNSASLIREFAKSTAHPYADSIAPRLYSLLPNSTDFTVFRNANFSGLNFALAGDWATYHSRSDTADRLSRRSLQHAGSEVLALVQRLGVAEFKSAESGSLAYFTFFGLFMILFSIGVARVLGLVVALAFVAVFAYGLTRRFLTIKGTLGGFLIFLGNACCVVAAARFLPPLIVRGHAGYEVYAGALYFPGLVLLSLGISVGVYFFLSRRIAVENLFFGALLCWVVLTVAVTVSLPEGSHHFTWPALSGVALGLLLLRKGVGSINSISTVAACVAVSLPGLAFVVSDVHLMQIAFIGSSSYMGTLLIAMGFGLAIPYVHAVIAPWQRLTFCALVVGAFSLIGLSSIGNRQHKEDRMFYIGSPDVQSAYWATDSPMRDEYASRFFDLTKARRMPGSFIPPWYLGLPAGNELVSGQAPLLDLPSPVIAVLDDHTSAGVRKLELRVESARQAPEIALRIQASDAIRNIEINGRALQKSGMSSDERAAPQSVAGAAAVTLYCVGVQKGGFILGFETRPAAPLAIKLIDRSYGLPDRPGFIVPPRPEYVVETRSSGDVTVLIRSVAL